MRGTEPGVCRTGGTSGGCRGKPWEREGEGNGMNESMHCERGRYIYIGNRIREELGGVVRTGGLVALPRYRRRLAIE